MPEDEEKLDEAGAIERLNRALEHMLEHLIMRKQDQVDFLMRARRQA